MRQVLAIHRHGSFARAAQALAISQPTLSKSIARLEDELKLVLFDRSGTGARVTPMGALIVERAERIVGEAARLRRDVELAAGGMLGKVAIGVDAGLSSTFLVRILEKAADRYPDLRLAMFVDAGDQLRRRMAAGELDMVVTAEAPGAPDPDFVRLPVIEEAAIAVAAPHHPLAGLDFIDRETFARHRSMSPPRETGFGTLAVLGLPEAADAPTEFYVLNDYEPAVRLAIKGVVTLLAPAHVVAPALAEGRLVRLNLDWSLDVAFVAIMPRAAGHSPVLRELAALAADVGREVVGRAASPN